MFWNNSFPLSLGLVQLQDRAVRDGTSLGNREGRAWAKLLHLHLQNVTSPLWKPLTPFWEKEPNGNDNWKTKEKQRPTLGQKEFCSFFPAVPAFSCSSLPQELPGWGIGNHLKTTLQKGGEMENTSIPSHLAESTPLGEERKFPALDVSFQKIPNANRDYLPLWSTKVLFKQKQSPGASYQHLASDLVPNCHAPTAKRASLQETTPAQWELRRAEHFLGVISDINATRSFNTFLVNCYFLTVRLFSPNSFCYWES